MYKLATIVFVAMLTVACRRETSSAPDRNESAPPPAASGGTITPRRAAVQSYADVVDKVTPAVVTIRSERRVRAPQQFPFFDDPLFRRFFGGALRRTPQPQQQVLGLGSGVIVSHDGYTLTNHHVIDGAEELSIEMPDHRRYGVKVVGSDAPSDLAVVKIDARNLPVLPLGNSDDVRVGDVALAVGNPLGIGQTVTMGIISAKGRSTGVSDGSFQDFLQTDAPINRGNSGGALVNTNGELVGINSQILSPTGASIGIGFAIPSNMAKNVMDQLIRNGKVRRGALGILVGTLTPEVAEKVGVKDTQGVLVAGVNPGGAADKAGLQKNDVIVAFNGQPVNDSNTFRNHVSSTSPGTDVTLRIRRGGREQDVHVRLGEYQIPKQQMSQDDDQDEMP